MTTLKKVEETLAKMYGIENIYRCRHDYFNHVTRKQHRMTLFYRASDDKHIGSHKPETREGWFYDFSKPTDFLPNVVML